MKNADSHLIAERYASALFDLASKDRALDAVSDELASLKQALSESGELRRLIVNPLMPRVKKADIMQAILKKASPTTQAFVRQMALASRLDVLNETISVFEKMLLEARGEASVVVESASPLQASQTKALTDALTRSLGKKVRLEARVNSALLGGLVIQSGGTRIDYSLQSRLNRLNSALKSTIMTA